MTIKGKGGRKRILKPGEKWVYFTLNFTPKEFKKMERLRGKKSRTSFFLDFIYSGDE